MLPISFPAITRRRFIQGASAAGFSLGQSSRIARADDTSAAPIVLRPGLGRAQLLPATSPDTAVWCFNGSVPGPEIRIRQGEKVRLTVENHLAEDTTVHWHGIRLPNAMDGVPGLTQSPIKPGESFVYEFTPPDAGTFWYHPHSDGLQQLGRGLAGVLIVEEREPVAVDRDIVWMLQDWRLNSEKQIAAGFGGAMDAVMSGRVGNLVTLNGSVSGDQPVRARERIRLRLINGALARIMALRFEGHRPLVVATDGQPCEPYEPEDGRLLLGPAMRIDVMLELQGEPGRRYAVVDDYYPDLSYNLTSLAYANDPPLRPAPLGAPFVLPRNPLPEPDTANADRFEVHLQGGMAGGGALKGLGGLNGVMTPGMDGGAAWAINGMSMTGDGQMGAAPLFTLTRGRSIVLTMHNETAWWHPMHLHGFSFRVLTKNGASVPHHQWGDTVLLAPRDVFECAFVADNPGDWMLHCHVADHQMAGLMTVLRVT